MSTDLSLQILVGAKDQASSVVENIAGNIVGKLSGVSPVAGAVAGGLMAIVGGSIAVGVASTHMAADFQTAMLSNVAHAGLAKDQFDKVSQSVLGMASAVGRSPTELAEALYPILSAFSGIQNQSAKSAIALDTLKMSFQTVAGTTVDGTAVANAAVGTFNALGLATDNVSVNTKRMTGLFDVMDKTVMLGNMQWDAYKNVVSKLAVAIQGTGLSFNESQAALATMTNEGFSAQRASTYLSNTFTTLAIKTDALAKHAKSLKISFDEQKYSSMSLADKIAYLNQVTDGNKQKLLALMGNNSTALKTFNALSVGISGYRSNLNALNHSQGALASSFDTASQGFNFQMKQIKAGFDALLITIGTQLLPVFSKLAAQVVPLIGQFTQWLVKSGALQAMATGLANGLTFVITTIATLVTNLTPLIAGFAQWLVQSGALQAMATGLANGLSFVITAITTLVTAGVAMVNFFQQNQWAADLLIGALSGIVAVLAVLAGIAIVNFIATIPAILAGFGAWAAGAGAAALATLAAAAPFVLIAIVVAGVVAGIVLAIQHWGEISAWLTAQWNTVRDFFTGLWSGVVATFNGAKNSIGSAINGVIGFFNQIKTPVEVAAGVITLFFAPALIKAGVEAAISGGKIAATFIKSMIQTGVEAAKNGAITSATFVKSMVQTGIESVKNGAIVTVNFVKSMILTGAAAVKNGAIVTATFIKSMVLTGIEAIKSGAIVTVNFVRSMIQTGIEGWAAAGKLLASIIPAFIKTGAQAAWAGIQIAAKFVVSLIQMGIQAAIAGAKMLISLVPAIISVATEGAIAAATAIPGLIIGFIGWAAAAGAAAIATLAAAWPILLIIAAIALLVVGIILLVTHWKQVTAFLQSAWHAAMTWLIGAFHTVANFFSSIWSDIVGFFRTHILLIVAIVTGPLGALIILIITHWAQIKQFFVNLWNDVVGIFHSAVTWLGDAITRIWDGLVTIVTTWPGKAVQWGVNLVKGFISGLLSMLGSVGNAAGQIIGKVTSFLGFHSPAKEGEGQHLLEWPRNMVKSYADELAAQTPYLHAKVSMLVAPLAIMSHSVPLTNNSRTPLTSVGAGGASAVINVTVNAPARTQDEAQEIAEAVSQKLARMWKGQGTLAGGLFS